MSAIFRSALIQVAWDCQIQFPVVREGSEALVQSFEHRRCGVHGCPHGNADVAPALTTEVIQITSLQQVRSA
jgi:hypothetical protein